MGDGESERERRKETLLMLRVEGVFSLRGPIPHVVLRMDVDASLIIGLEGR